MSDSVSWPIDVQVSVHGVGTGDGVGGLAEQPEARAGWRRLSPAARRHAVLVAFRACDER
jgi:hypothetical protein